MYLSKRVLAMTAAATLTLAGCGADDETASTTTTAPRDTTTTAAPDGTTTSTTSTTSTTTTRNGDRRLTQSCTHDERDVRISVRYPEGWHVNDPQVQPCSAFDPEPLDLDPFTEYPRDVAVILRVEPFALDKASAPTGLRVESEREATVDGRAARRQTVVSTGEGLYPAGTRSFRYVIDGGTQRSIIVTTFDVEGNDFAQSSDVLEAMVNAFEIDPYNG